MNNFEPKIEIGVEEKIKPNYSFLFERGYTVYEAKELAPSFDAWDLKLKRGDFFIYFFNEKGGLDVSFGSPSKGYVNIYALVYFLSKEKDFIKSGSGCLGIFFPKLNQTANLLKKYIDKFETSFEHDFPKTEQELKNAEERYFNRRYGR